jgi:hypothetical protein
MGLFTSPRLSLTRLTAQLCILYLLAFLDRTNIGNAKIDGLQASLHKMSTGRYNAALSIFFVSYSAFEPLTNILLKRLRPSVFIPIIMYVLPRIIRPNLMEQDPLGNLHDFYGLLYQLVWSDGCACKDSSQHPSSHLISFSGSSVLLKLVSSLELITTSPAGTSVKNLASELRSSFLPLPYLDLSVVFSQQQLKI